VNPRIARLYVVMSLGTVLLILACTYWQVWAAPSLAAKRNNPRLVYRELAIDRGSIITADGVVLARNRERRANGRTLFFRRYPQGPTTAAVVGYSSLQASRAGVERAQNGYLTGSDTDLAGGLEQVLGSLKGQTVKGNDVILALDAAAQRVAMRDLRTSGHRGAVVAMEPATGRVLTMATWPTYDPNLVDTAFAKVAAGRDGALLNRTTQGLYPPGSTFKVVTAATALETGTFTPTSTFAGGRCITVYRPLCNAANEVAPTPNSLADALVYSYNTTFARVGQKVGLPALVDQMKRFGFWSLPPLDYPSDQMAISGIYTAPGRLASPRRRADVARVAIGQAGLLVTPLQMAMVTAAIANGGLVVAPRLLDRVRSPSGRLVYEARTEPIGQAISAATAATLTSIMQRVVDEGTGQQAQLNGLEVAGKTGTAQTSRPGLNDAWFIAFAPVRAPKVAIAVVIEDTPDYGGVAAAPIARDVLQSLLGAG
jgi:peptidoglycan glycosyltransferase